MNDDFLDYCDRDGEYAPIPTEGDIIEDIHRETALLEKKGAIAVLSLAYGAEDPDGNRGCVLKYDPRDDEHFGNFFKTEEAALEAWETALRDSIKNGWRIFHRGDSNHG